MEGKSVPQFQHAGAALWRAPAGVAGALTDQWPHPDDAEDGVRWLTEVAQCEDLMAAVEDASPSLATAIIEITDSGIVNGKERTIRRVVLSTARYVLRARYRATPFGLLAGAAPTMVSDAQFRPSLFTNPCVILQPDSAWVDAVVDHLERIPAISRCTRLQANTLLVTRNEWAELHTGRGTIRVTRTAAVDYVLQATTTPVLYGDIVAGLLARFPGSATDAEILIAGLLRQRALLSSLRPTFTQTNPAQGLVYQLDTMGAAEVPAARKILTALKAVCRVAEPSVSFPDPADAVRVADALDTAATASVPVETKGRCVNTEVHFQSASAVPETISREAAFAAGALLQLSRNPAGDPSWAAYHHEFCEYYGTGVLVPLRELLHPDTGLGYPAGYPGSKYTHPAPRCTERDAHLMSLAMEAVREGGVEMVLTEDLVNDIAQLDKPPAVDPPHVEICATVFSESLDHIRQGRYTMTVRPARGIGVMTSRFAANFPEHHLNQVISKVPPTFNGMYPAQLSFGGAYPYAGNIVRIPRHLGQLITLGEHRSSTERPGVFSPSDLAVMATNNRLYVVSLPDRTVLEPISLHALELSKQPHPMARFLANLVGGFRRQWTAFDWGPGASKASFLPRIRYRRAILRPATWQLRSTDVTVGSSRQEFSGNFLMWAQKMQLPQFVTLEDSDKTLPLNHTNPLHQNIIQEHLRRHGQATLTETLGAPPHAISSDFPCPNGEPAATSQTTPHSSGRHQLNFNWTDGKPHEIVIPLTATKRPTLAVDPSLAPVWQQTFNSSLPEKNRNKSGSWVYARIECTAEQHASIISQHLPELMSLGQKVWFVRYRSPHQPHHLRIRVAVPQQGNYSDTLAAVMNWSVELQHQRLVGPFSFDTYRPEVGRYGTGPTLAAAESVFCADSAVVMAQYRSSLNISATVLAAANMLSIVSAFMGPNGAQQWIIDRRRTGPPIPPEHAETALHLLRRCGDAGLPEWNHTLRAAWAERADTVRHYAGRFVPSPCRDVALESLLHMHHNRAVGIEPDSEALCHKLLRQTALTMTRRKAAKETPCPA